MLEFPNFFYLSLKVPYIPFSGQSEGRAVLSCQYCSSSGLLLFTVDCLLARSSSSLLVCVGCIWRFGSSVVVTSHLFPLVLFSYRSALFYVLRWCTDVAWCCYDAVLVSSSYFGGTIRSR